MDSSAFRRLIDPEYADILRSLIALPVRARRQGALSLILAQQDMRYRIELRNFVRKLLAALKGLPRWGRERHSEHSGRAFTGVGAACQRPGAQRSRKAFRVLCGTGLDGS